MRQSSLRRVFHFRGSLLGRIQGDREPVSFVTAVILIMAQKRFGYIMEVADNSVFMYACTERITRGCN